MPRFFVPENGPVQSEDLYQWIVRYVQAMLDCRIEPARIFSITYTCEGQQMVATVGETDPRTGQLIIAILRSDDYLICTPYYGVRRGEPIRVAASDAGKVEFFEGLDNAREQLRQAVTFLDHAGGSLQSRLQSAALALESVSLEDFPAIMAAGFLSLQHRLAWRGNYAGTISQMPDAEAQAAAMAMRTLYVDVLSSVTTPRAASDRR
jgi:hypothetical protein